MPPQRPAKHGFSEAAIQFRRYQAWSTHDNSIAAAAIQSSSSTERDGDSAIVEDARSANSSARRPSTRRLDRRWDRSRGVVFSSPRSPASSATKHMVSTIGFDQTREYASRSVSRPSTASAPTSSPSKTHSRAPSAASVVEAGWKGGLHASSGHSFKQGDDLEKKIRELSDEVTKFKARLKDRDAKVDVQERQIASLRSSATEMESKMLRAKSQAQRDLLDQKSRHQKELDRLGPRIAENQAYVADLRSRAETPLRAEIHRLVKARSESNRELETLKVEMAEQQKRHEVASRNAMIFSREIKFALAKANKEIGEMKKRKLEDREDYTRYHHIFAELNDKIHTARDEVRRARRRIDEEIFCWQKSARHFKSSANLRLFLFSSKYEGTKNAILEFLKARASHAQTISDELRQMEVRITERKSAMVPCAHVSRHLTRHHQLDEHQSAYNSTNLAHRLATGVPFERLRREYAEDIAHLTKLKNESPSRDMRERLAIQIQELMDHRKKLKRFLIFFGYLQEWRALQALQDDDIVEKAVWVDTIEAKLALDKAVQRFHDIIDESSLQHTTEWMQSHHHREDVRLQRIKFDDLVTQVRQKHLLASDLGKMTNEEKASVEVTIDRRTELAKRAVDGGLAGLGFQKPLPRRRAPIEQQSSKGRPATVVITAENTPPVVKSKTTNTSPPPPVGLDVLKARLQASFSETLQARLAKKKNRSQAPISAEKTISASKPAVQKSFRARKVLAGKRKKAQVGSSSLKASKSEPENSMGGETKIKGSASGIEFSALKPTKSRQAQYSQPSYDREAGADERAPRGDNMGFATLRNALAGAGASFNAHGGPASSSKSPQQIDSLETSSDSASESGISSSGSSSADQSSSETLTEEPQTVLSYNIAPADYRSAAIASPSSSASYWSHNLYKNSDNQRPVVYYCQSYEQSEARAKLFLNEPVLGFDLEWEFASNMKGDKPDIKRNVSLIQIACEDKIGLFQLARFRTAKTVEEHMPPSLKKILESADVVKAGVNVNGDANRLKKCLGVDMQGTFELSHLFRVVKQSKKIPVNFGLVKLSQQVQDVLLLPLKKDAVRVSAWSKELNTQQTSYAAADAYAGFQLFHKLDNQRKLMVPRPPRPAFYETFKPIVLGDGTEVLRSTEIGSKKKEAVKSGRTVAEEVEEEDEEFFDAAEEIDPYELGETTDLVGGDDGSSVADQEISYPSLPTQDAGSRSVGGATPAQSRTMTLPLRAKLAPKATAPPPQPADCLSPDNNEEEEEALSINRMSRPGPLPCPENQAAETWIMTYRSKNPSPSIGTPTLRAYHLWHHQRFELKEVARFCRDPPLAMTTVASYVMQALKEGKLPFEGNRVKGVLGILPVSVHGRYRAVVERSGV